ncbi:MAG: MBL fold metallo-hydrolase, partial [Candidatus Omnitrophica bacterium]|nr:MBL fold metallo-hydrolase [Candidatus Omnitrophota bacterium]
LLGPLRNFVYILGDPTTRQALVIDPGWDSQAILDRLAEHDLTLAGLLVTHTHFDHINAVGELLKAADVPVYVHKAERDPLPARSSSITRVGGGDEVPLGAHVVRILHTPGHTPGSSCFLVNDRLLSGDTLFVKACGRSDLPGGDPEQLYHSLDQIATLDEQITVYPGHDYGDAPQSTVGDEKRQNPFLQFPSPQAFVRAVTGGA